MVLSMMNNALSAFTIEVKLENDWVWSGCRVWRHLCLDFESCFWDGFDIFRDVFWTKIHYRLIHVPLGWFIVHENLDGYIVDDGHLSLGRAHMQGKGLPGETTRGGSYKGMGNCLQGVELTDYKSKTVTGRQGCQPRFIGARLVSVRLKIPSRLCPDELDRAGPHTNALCNSEYYLDKIPSHNTAITHATNNNTIILEGSSLWKKAVWLQADTIDWLIHYAKLWAP